MRVCVCVDGGIVRTTQAPEIANWLCSLEPDKRMVVGSYVYLDGELFVKVSVACDAIIAKVLAKRKNAAIAMLGTPTDVYVVPREAREAGNICVCGAAMFVMCCLICAFRVIAAKAHHSLSNFRNWPLIPALLLRLVAFRNSLLVPNYGPPVLSKTKDQTFYLCEGITLPQGGEKWCCRCFWFADAHVRRPELLPVEAHAAVALCVGA